MLSSWLVLGLFARVHNTGKSVGISCMLLRGERDSSIGQGVIVLCLVPC